MARNLQDELLRARMGTQSFLSPELIRGGIDKTREDADINSNRYLQSLLGPEFARRGVSDVQGPVMQKGRQNLTGEAIRSLRGRNVTEQRSRAELVYNTAYQRILKATGDQDIAVEAAKQATLNEIKRGEEKSDLEKGMSSGRRIEDIADNENEQYISMYNQQVNSASESKNAALMRALFGLGSQLATAGVIKGMQGSGGGVTGELPNIKSDSSSLRIGSGFSPYSFYNNRQPISFNPANIYKNQPRYGYNA